MYYACYIARSCAAAYGLTLAGTRSKLFLGWGFLISSNKLEELSKLELLEYFKENDVALPSEEMTSLEICEFIRNHHKLGTTN